MNEAHEGGDGLLASEGDAPEAFEFVKEAFDLMALLVEAPVDGRFGGTAGVGLDVGGCAKIVSDEGPQRIGIIGSIGNDVADTLQARQESLGLRTVAIVSRRRVDTDRQADGIDDRMQLGGQAAARTTDGGTFSPPFAPAASA